MKKSFIFTAMVFVLILFIIISNLSYLNPYNTDFFHPLFGVLLPLTLLLFFSSFLKNVQSKSVFISISIFCVIIFIILAAIEPVCSTIVCYDRNSLALIISSLFSVVYFIVLLFKNRKQSTLV